MNDLYITPLKRTNESTSALFAVGDSRSCKVLLARMMLMLGTCMYGDNEEEEDCRKKTVIAEEHISKYHDRVSLEARRASQEKEEKEKGGQRVFLLVEERKKKNNTW